MNTRLLASIALLAFVTLAVFGLYLPMADHMGHAGCPFAPAGAEMCIAPLDHIKHYQSSFVAVLAELIALLSIALVFITWTGPHIQRDVHYERYRLRVRIPIRPPLLQELFSQGILNRKEPSIYSRAY